MGLITQDNIHAEFLRAGELQTAGRLAEAEALWRAIVSAAPASAEARCNLGATLLAQGRLSDAEGEIAAAARQAPESLSIRGQLGRVYAVTGRLAEAEQEYAKALALRPDDPGARLDLGYVRLGRGDYAGGWPLYEARKDVAGQNAERLPLPNEWQGEPLAGRSLLIWPEQGFGDQIQAARFAPILRDRGARVTLVAPPELSALFTTLGVEVVAQTPSLTLPVPDHWTLPLSIPGRLGVTLETIPAKPYLAAPAAHRAQWSSRVQAGGVGIAWRGRATHRNDAHRSLPEREMLAGPLAAAGARIVDLTDPVGDFADLAAVVEQLDLVVTVDTALAHVAGALGKPCWVLLPWFRTDWRWLQERGDSPWYPSLRLFRQPAYGDWGSVIAEVARTFEMSA